MQGSRLSLKRCLHLGRKLRHSPSAVSSNLINPKETSEYDALFKKIIRKSEWTGSQAEEKQIYRELGMSPSALLSGIHLYTSTSIVTDTQFSHIILLLSALPLTTSTAPPPPLPYAAQEQLSRVFANLDSYAYARYFELGDVGIVVAVLLRLQAAVNATFDNSAEVAFGGSVVAGRLGGGGQGEEGPQQDCRVVR
jgi:hypothetical protein